MGVGLILLALSIVLECDSTKRCKDSRLLYISEICLIVGLSVDRLEIF